MFRHKGKSRKQIHNLQVASLLSFVAGIVNVAGFFAAQKLTTNVTGHFAYFVEELFKKEFIQAFVYFMYVIFFFLGSFFSSLIIEIYNKKKNYYNYTYPILLESFIFVIVAFFGNLLIDYNSIIVVNVLLFAMGLQNSLVTRISNSVVRTTHLTGLFTDLGIEISQLFFYKKVEQQKKLYHSIKLRFSIILFFFLGGLISGIFYTYIQLHILLVAATLLLFALYYDFIRVLILRKFKKK